jgi:SAM-dependent methyltransferase
MSHVEMRIQTLDVGLYGCIESQTTPNDRKSLLAIQSVMRSRLREPFVYLEIGSHLGGSLQPLVVDPNCARIVSIDPRPLVFPDGRGLDLNYPDNSTSRMLTLLGDVPGANIAKITTIESSTDALPASAVKERPDYCFIDGEHTDTAALRDAQFCLQVVNPDGCLVFHDANLIYRGLERFLWELERIGRAFRTYILSDSIAVVELGACEMMDIEPVRTLLRKNYQAYLYGLRSYEWYLEVLNRPLFRLLRRTRFVRRLFVVPGIQQQGV